jgi:hypothetical protein
MVDTEQHLFILAMNGDGLVLRMYKKWSVNAKKDMRSYISNLIERVCFRMCPASSGTKRCCFLWYLSGNQKIDKKI